MADDSDVFLVRGSLQLLAPAGMNNTRTLFFSSATTAIQSWRADADYFVIGCTSNSNSIFVLSLDGTPTTIATAVDRVTASGGLIHVQQGFTGFLTGFHFPIKKNDKIYWAPAASGQFVNVYLEYA